MLKAKNFDFDYIVIGSGPAGKIGAIMASNAGLKTAIIESSYWGGTGLARELISSSTLSFAHDLKQIRLNVARGIYDSRPRMNLSTIFSQRRRMLHTLQESTFESLISSNVKCIKGKAIFSTPNTIIVGEKEISAEHFLLATGYRFTLPKIDGLKTTKFLTSENAYNFPMPPKSVFIVGGGPSGCEIAEYYASLGSKVIIAELSSRLLPKEDEDTSLYVSGIFTKSGINILTKTRVIGVSENNSNNKVIHFMQNGETKQASSDIIILATGSEPNLDAIQKINLKTNHNKIETTPFLQSSLKNIWIAGDLVGNFSSTEKSEYESALATANILNRTKTAANYRGFTRNINLSPAISSVGYSELDCIRRDLKYKKIQIPVSDIFNSKISGHEFGFIKILVEAKKGSKILGATVISENASDIIQEISFAIRQNLDIRSLINTPHSALSGVDIIRIAARQV